MGHHFNTVRKGYDTAEVDRYVQKLEDELSDFRRNQDSIAKSIIHAENTAQNIITDANKEAEKVRMNAGKQLLDLQKKIKHMRMKLDAFQSSYNQLMHKYIITMNGHDFKDLYDSLDHINDSLNIDGINDSKKKDIPNSTSQEKDLSFKERVIFEEQLDDQLI